MGIKIMDSTGAWAVVKPFSSAGATASAATDTTAVELKAAVATKRIFVTKWRITNITAGEYPVAELLEKTATPTIKATAAVASDTAAGLITRELTFNPPLELTVSVNCGYRLQSATGDCYSSIDGYIEV